MSASSVRAKFTCTSNVDGSISLHPVVASTDNEENTRFFNATPSGSVALGVLNPDAAAFFEVGSEYYLDFSKAGADVDEEDDEIDSDPAGAPVPGDAGQPNGDADIQGDGAAEQQQ